ncbi:MAG: helix-turn-helix domain-containing protein [Porphyrobacter sp. IPPAS B-1204]|nr:MAG: helix-turn-helix domain-containing protein [Porphyrobacter sp. IPPAS B-1204]
MAIKAHLEQAAAGDGQRAATRRALRLEASGLAPDGEEANVTIHNISAAGLLIETALDLAAGEQLALDLPEAGIVTAAVVWRSERLYGCAFEQALGPAALAAVQLQGFSPGTDAPAQPAAAATINPSEGLGARLNRLRREAGLTLADVAAALSVSKPTVWAWEKGKARPLPERLDAIAAALGVSPELLAPGPITGELDTVIAECRQRIAEASGAAPQAVRIMIEL